LQFFLNVTEFGMTVQEAVEAANVNTYQLYLSLGGEDRKPKPGSILLNSNTPDYIRRELIKMGYKLSFDDRTSGPVNAIYFDRKHGTFWGGSSNHGEDYGVGW
jgi:gamma-glutamyltranspeptidase/glutathione hydrolase